MSQAQDILDRYGAGISRPLRYVQLNSFCNGSTGTIMRRLGAELTALGADSYCLWGRRHETVDDHNRCVATKTGVYVHGALSRVTGRAGFYSKSDTHRLLALLDEIDPDVIHLHNIHGYWVNVEMLFNWLSSHRCQVRWTLHDCWSFTGHCAHFTYVKCAQWKEHCAYSEKCPQLRTYPKTYLFGACKRNFTDKKRLFTLVPTERMTIVTPSQWLAALVKESFLSGYPVRVVHNQVDHMIFKPTPSDFRQRYAIGDRFMILGVASPWTERKGLEDFAELARELDQDRFAVVLVGLSKKQMKMMPKEVIGLARTSSREELAGIYSTANLFLNPTREDNFPTVNLEAEACGTPVWTYDTGGCAETIALPSSKVISGLEEMHEIIRR